MALLVKCQVCKPKGLSSNPHLPCEKLDLMSCTCNPSQFYGDRQENPWSSYLYPHKYMPTYTHHTPKQGRRKERIYFQCFLYPYLFHHPQKLYFPLFFSELFQLSNKQMLYGRPPQGKVFILYRSQSRGIHGALPHEKLSNSIFTAELTLKSAELSLVILRDHISWRTTQYYSFKEFEPSSPKLGLC